MAIYYAKGIINNIGEVQSGTSASGREWARMTLLIEIPGYQGSSTKLSLNVNTDRIGDVTEYEPGDRVEVGFTVYAREYKDKYYNSVDLINIKDIDAQQPTSPTPAPTTAPTPARIAPSANELDPAAHQDDLPF